MSIGNLDIDEFKRILQRNLTPAEAISDPHYLRGRGTKLRQIDRAFNSPGMHVFIYGDRGVGKTSLAQSAAVLRQSADAQPLVVACDQEAGFFKLVQDIVAKCVPPLEMIEIRKKSKGFSLKLPGISYEIGKSIENKAIPLPSSINEAVSFLSFVRQFHSKEPVIIIDEFDQLKEARDKKYFADLIKQTSDQHLGIRMIFCGISSSLEELIGAHLSTDRYLTPIELERLNHDARWEIVSSVARELDIKINREYLIRIGYISDDFPYYVHLIAEKIFWEMYDDDDILLACHSRHFKSGVNDAVASAQTTLRLAYDRATQKYSDDYQEVLWAVADDVMLRRQVSDIYSNSYMRIINERIADDKNPRKILDKTQFYNRMNSLRTERHGSILVAKGAGWYEFRENVVRGYVRLRAESQGIELGRDHFAPA
ncbi:MAG: AAA family ATPase [Stellaceae bacterium]